VDGHEVWRTDASATTYALTYTQVSVPNLASFANGAEPKIAFNSTTNSPDEGLPTIFVVDDVSLDYLPYQLYLSLVRK
jgi:hypothetical protein